MSNNVSLLKQLYFEVYPVLGKANILLKFLFKKERIDLSNIFYKMISQML